MTNIKKKVSLMLVLLSLFGLLSGCMTGDVAETEPPLPENDIVLETPNIVAVDNVFSLNINRDVSLNPMTTTDANNVLCTQLMYENIYNVDNTFTASSNIVLEASCDNGINWMLTIDTSVTFWDGSTLTASDVAYSLQRAKQSSRLRERLTDISGISAMSENQVAITLVNYNMQLPNLLTIPVIKEGSIEESAPLGTGPYMPDEGRTKLVAFSGHRDFDTLPLDTIYLKEIRETDKAITAYENSEIDLVQNDPTGLLNLGYGAANDLRYYPTTNMHYLGFNSRSRFFSNPLCRKAMTYVVNREHIVNDVLGGAAVEAALPMNPVSPLYNSIYSELVSYSVKKSEDAFYEAEVRDYDDDDFREIMITGIPVETDIVFIVCGDNAQKLAAAQSIADNLTNLGIKVELRSLTWDQYVSALQQGKFDMYYAETMLTADFNPSNLLLKNRALNYGKFEDLVLAEKINNYMLAPDSERRREADFMNQYIVETAPIVTICFERHQVVSHRGVISGMKPSQYNVFQNIGEWKVNLGD